MKHTSYNKQGIESAATTASSSKKDMKEDEIDEEEEFEEGEELMESSSSHHVAMHTTTTTTTTTTQHSHSSLLQPSFFIPSSAATSTQFPMPPITDVNSSSTASSASDAASRSSLYMQLSMQMQMYAQLPTLHTSLTTPLNNHFQPTLINPLFHTQMNPFTMMSNPLMQTLLSPMHQQQHQLQMPVTVVPIFPLHQEAVVEEKQRGKWSLEEDRLLREAVKTYGGKSWRKVFISRFTLLTLSHSSMLKTRVL